MSWLLLLAQAAWAQALAPDIDALRAACEGDEASACFQLAHHTLRGEGVAQDPEAAVRLFRRACDGGDGDGCLHLAEAVRLVEGGSSAELAAIYERACELGEGSACRSRADLHVSESADSVAAQRWYQIGCDLHDGPSCTAVGLALECGEEGAPLPAEARRLFDQACGLGHARGCTQLAIRYERGDRVRRDRALAASLYAKGCAAEEWDPEACREIGLLQHQGRLVPASPESALRNLEKACMAGDSPGCRGLADLLRRGQAWDDALNAAERGCDLGDAGACRRTRAWRRRL